MAVVSGFLGLDTLRGFDFPGYISTDLELYGDEWINDINYWLGAVTEGIEVLTTHWPVSTTPRTLSGSLGTNFVDDFYNRIHVVPPVLDIGNLLSVQTRSAAVWNAHFSPRTLASIGESGTAGLTESGIAAPTTFAPLEERAFDVTVDTEGPATIGARYTFNFPSEAPTLAVTGRRVVVFSHRPNWAEPLTESYAWLTDVIESHGGVEQRIGLRGVPRRGLAYSLNTLDAHASARLQILLRGWQARLFAVPIWTDAQTLTANLPAGSTSIPASTIGYEFAPADLCLLWRGHEEFEALEVESVGAGVGLISPTLIDWPAGTRLLPIRLGRLPSRQALDRLTASHLGARVEFSFDDHPGWPAADTGDLYLGYRVYAERPNWARQLEVAHVRKLAELDYSTGTPWVDDESGFTTEIKSWNWTLTSRAKITEFRNWLAARAGRRTAFWSETQGVDMALAATIGASTPTLQIRNIGYARLVNARADCRHVVLRTLAGAVYYREITSAVEDSATLETLAIDSPLGVSVSPDEVASLRFIHLSRLESDSIEIDWQTMELAQATAAIRSLPA